MTPELYQERLAADYLNKCRGPCGLYKPYSQFRSLNRKGSHGPYVSMAGKCKVCEAAHNRVRDKKRRALEREQRERDRSRGPIPGSSIHTFFCRVRPTL